MIAAAVPAPKNIPIILWAPSPKPTKFSISVSTSSETSTPLKWRVKGFHIHTPNASITIEDRKRSSNLLVKQWCITSIPNSWSTINLITMQISSYSTSTFSRWRSSETSKTSTMWSRSNTLSHVITKFHLICLLIRGLSPEICLLPHMWMALTAFSSTMM